MNQDSNDNPEGIKDPKSIVLQTEEEDYEVALKWLADFKNKIAIYTGKLSIPHGVINLLSEDLDLFDSVRNNHERHDAKVSPHISLEEKAEMIQLRQQIYDECNYVLGKFSKARPVDSHIPNDDVMSTMGKAGANKRWSVRTNLLLRAAEMAEKKWADGDLALHNQMADSLLALDEFKALSQYRKALLKELGPVAVEYGRRKGDKGTKKEKK